MDKAQIRHGAYEILNRRRQNALDIQKSHEEEVLKKLPHIAEYKAELARSSVELTSAIIKHKGGSIKDEIEKIRARNRQASSEIKRELVRAGYPEDYLEVRYRCEKCGDTGQTLYGICDCLREAERQYASEQLNRESGLDFKSFDTFDLSRFDNVYVDGMSAKDVMSGVLAAAKGFCRDFETKKENLFFIGSPGLGKTHLAMACAGEITMKGYNVIYGTVFDQIMSISKENYSSAHVSDTLESMKKCDLLIMGELGAESANSFSEAVIYNIIGTRLNSSLPTIITSNNSVADLKKLYNPRIISRLSFNFKMLKFVGEDSRRTFNGWL